MKMQPTDPRVWTCQALTDIWTGDAHGKPDRLITTGLLGSIRWWFEVLVRGLGGSACDPTKDGTRCPDARKKPGEPGHRCVVCELFGCTGWARKFRFQVLAGKQGDEIQSGAIQKDAQCRLRFVPLRDIAPVEWALLDLTLRLIAGYGAIGGKTVYKPSEEPGLADLDLADFEVENGTVKVARERQGLPLSRTDIVKQVKSDPIGSLDELRKALTGKCHGEAVDITVERHHETKTVAAWYGKRHHRDYGLVSVEKGPSLTDTSKRDPKAHVRNGKWRSVQSDGSAWASLEHFWCVNDRYLARQDGMASRFNQVIGREEQKPQGQRIRNDQRHANQWLAGRQGESKKVFSFKNPARTFGFVKPGTVSFDDIKKRLAKAWKDLRDDEFLKGDAILDRLLSDGARKS